MFTKKKIPAFVMLLAVTAPLLFFACFLVKQRLIQNDMEKRVENSLLQTVTVKATDIQWITINKEAVINGKLFDISSSTIKGDQVVLTGLYDNDEDGLNKQFSNFIQQKNNPSSPLANAVIKFLFPPLYNNATDQLCQNTWQHITSDFFPCYQEKIAERYFSILTPPPKLV